MNRFQIPPPPDRMEPGFHDTMHCALRFLLRSWLDGRSMKANVGCPGCCHRLDVVTVQVDAVAAFRILLGPAFAPALTLTSALIRCQSQGSRSHLRKVCHLLHFRMMHLAGWMRMGCQARVQGWVCGVVRQR